LRLKELILLLRAPVKTRMLPMKMKPDTSARADFSPAYETVTPDSIRGPFKNPGCRLKGRHDNAGRWWPVKFAGHIPHARDFCPAYETGSRNAV